MSIDDLQAAHEAAHAAWDGARRAHLDACALRDDLRARAVAGDTKVTSAALAKAQDEAEHAGLPVPALHARVLEIEAQLRQEIANEKALAYSRELDVLEDRVARAQQDAEAAVESWLDAWSEHASVVGTATNELAGILQASPGELSRARFDHVRHRVTVDGKPILRLPVFDPLSELVEGAAKRLTARGFKPSPALGRRS